jgi:hypothetical protein
MGKQEGTCIIRIFRGEEKISPGEQEELVPRVQERKIV